MYDVIVIGAGPAGCHAALDTGDCGLKVMLIDEGRDAGGQVWRPKSKSIIKAPITANSKDGDLLRERIKTSDIELRFESRVWQIECLDDNCWRIAVVGPGAEKTVVAKSLIIATGAQERIIPVPGWTLPGVFGLAGATALFKEHMMVPGRRTIVAGNGPLVFYVASEILRLGGCVAAIATLNNRMDWLKALPAMLLRPTLLLQGFKWILSLYLKRIPIHWSSGLKSIEGHDRVEGATIIKVDTSWAPKGNREIYVPAESVNYGQGLMPAIEATNLIGAEHYYDEQLGGWVPTIDEYGRTSVRGVYVCGDNAGILGVGAAPIRGKLAAKALLEDLNCNNNRKISPKSLKRVEKFGRAMTALSIPRSGLTEFIKPQTEICRCEGITREATDGEMKLGANSHNSVKSGTRCGMGPCGGRFCMETLAIIAEHKTARSREEIGLPTARPPLRPVAMADLSEKFDYDDLPIPGVSPL